MLLASACQENVLIGRNPRSDGGGTDAGAGDAGVPDGGSADAGAGDAGDSDGGSADAGGGDAGAADGGGTDAGASDAGLSDGGSADAGGGDAGFEDGGDFDAGAGDAGLPDGGSADAGGGDAGLDAGAGDGGPPRVQVGFVVPLCAERGETAALRVELENFGGSSAPALSATVRLPAGTVVVDAPGCVAAGADTLSCDGGALASGARRELPLVVTYSLIAEGTQHYGVEVLGVDAGVVDVVTALTGLGVALFDPQGAPLDGGSCVGSGLTAFSQCPGASILRDTLFLLPDAGVQSDDGAPVRWHQSPSRRNLCLQSFGPTGGVVLWGASTSATCVEGLMDDWVNRQDRIGAWRACH